MSLLELLRERNREREALRRLAEQLARRELLVELALGRRRPLLALLRSSLETSLRRGGGA